MAQSGKAPGENSRPETEEVGLAAPNSRIYFETRSASGLKVEISIAVIDPVFIIEDRLATSRRFIRFKNIDGKDLLIDKETIKRIEEL